MKTEKKMVLSFFLNLLFTIVEVIGALLTNSVALLSDAIHDIGDSVSIGISIFLERKSRKKANFKYTYGYYRFSLLGGMIASLILIVGSTVVIYEAVFRLFNPETVDATKLVYFAIAGVVVNGAAALNMIRSKSMNEKVISLHLLEDVFGWLTILIAAILINIFKIDILDTLLSIGFTLFILYRVFKNLKAIMEVFLEKAPHDPTIEKISKKLMTNEEVIDVYHIHLWSLEGNIPIITLHATIKKGVSIEEINNIQNILHKDLHQLGIDHATIQIEFEGMNCNYNDCKDLSDKITKNHHHHHH